MKKEIYQQISRVGKAVASPARLELLDLLTQGSRTVEALAREAGLSVANASQHLRILRSARLVETDKDGLFVICRLADPKVGDFFLTLRALAEDRLADIDRIVRQFMEGREPLEPVEKESLLDRVREGIVTVVDVRPREEYRAGHIPGAVSVPVKELELYLSRLPSDRQIVAYCRGPYCVLAIDAVEILRAHGFRAMRLDDGVLEWQARGLALAVGEETAAV